MIDFADDIGAILDDAGGLLASSQGSVTGTFVTEPIETQMPSGQIAMRSQPMLHTSQAEIDRVGLAAGDWIECNGKRYTIRTIPEPETTGLVSIELSS